jgi:hypothetical protein
MAGAYDDVAACAAILRQHFDTPDEQRDAASGSKAATELLLQAASCEVAAASAAAAGALCRSSSARPAGDEERQLSKEASVHGREAAPRYFLHLDAALGGLILPFLTDPAPLDPPCQALAAAPDAAGQQDPEACQQDRGACSTEPGTQQDRGACSTEPGTQQDRGACSTEPGTQQALQEAGPAGAGAASKDVAAACAQLVRRPSQALPSAELAAEPSAVAAGAAGQQPGELPPFPGLADWQVPAEVSSMSISMHKQLGIGVVAAAFICRRAVLSQPAMQHYIQ